MEKKFTQQHLQVIEETIIALLRQEPFFAYLVQKMNRIYDPNLKADAGVNITNTINLYINPIKFAQSSLDIRVDTLKHECFHIMFEHIMRYKDLNTDLGFAKTKDGTEVKFSMTHALANIAMDCAINQIGLNAICNEKIEIEEDDKKVLKDKYITIGGFRELIGKDYNDQSIEEKQTFEYYYELLKEAAKKNAQKLIEQMEQLESLDDHELMKGSCDSCGYMGEIVRQAVKNAKNAASNISGDLALLIDKILKSKIDWKRELRIYLGRSLKYIKKATRKKLNRRFGIIFQGKKKEYQSKVAFIVDTSGSMSDEALCQAWAEVHKIQQQYPAIQIYFIEADAEVNNVREFNVKLKPEIKGRGGTMYQPALDKAEELGVDSIIYFGDMDNYDKETLKKPKCPVLWVIVGDQKPPVEWGKSIYLPKVEGE